MKITRNTYAKLKALSERKTAGEINIELYLSTDYSAGEESGTILLAREIIKEIAKEDNI